MLTEEEHRRGAEALLCAETERKAIPKLSRTFNNIEIAAYRIQDLWANLGAQILLASWSTSASTRPRMVASSAMSIATQCASGLPWITPVPGGVGPMTVTMLIENTVRAAQRMIGLASAIEEPELCLS